MKKMALLVLMSGMMLGTSCPGGNPLICANNLDGAIYGFTMTVPQEFACSEQLPSLLIQRPILSVVLYVDETNNRSLTVLVREPGQQGEDSTPNPDVTYADLPNHTTPSGIEFGIRKGTNTSGAVTYIAGAEISSGGNLLGVFLDAQADNQAVLLAKLTQIIDTVVRTGG